MTQLETQKQTTRLDEDPTLLKDAQTAIHSMNDMAEHLERARSPRRQAEIAESIEAEKRWLRSEGIMWEEQNFSSTSVRYMLKQTEKQLKEFAEMIHHLNVKSQERDIEVMYRDLGAYLNQLQRVVLTSQEDVKERKLGRLGGSNELKVYADSAWDLIQRIQASEKVFALVTRNESDI